MTRTPVFILGMPRCRTAWLSLCASALGSDITHEGRREFSTFAEYADDLDARLEDGPSGDADPGLVSHLAEILTRWPDARFAVVAREDDDGMEALVRATTVPAETIRAGWGAYLTTFKAACDRLRARGDVARFWMAHNLSAPETACDALEWITGRRPSLRWMKRKLRLRVVTDVDLSVPPPPHEVPPQIPSAADIDTAGLTVAHYRAEDFPMICDWWQAHTGELLPQVALPPLGVVVSHEGSPVAALWCYEFFGVSIAELCFPTTRPGLDLASASRALLFAVTALLNVAGKCHTPAASFKVFKVVTQPAFARYLRKLGFRDSLVDRITMVLTL